MNIRSLPAWIVVVLSFVLSGCRSQAPNLKSVPVAVRDLPPETHDFTQEYRDGFPMQVAVLLTKREETGIGIIRALHEMGIPFFCTRDLSSAIRHPHLILYPSVDGHTFNPAESDELARFVKNGGVVFGQNVFSGALRTLFGFREFVPSRQRHWVHFATPDPVLRYLDRPEEKSVRLGDEKIREVIWTNGFAPDTNAHVLARFEDGSAALLRNAVGKGTAYLMGVSLEDVVARSQADRDYEAQRVYANAFEPGADVWLLVLRAWYESATPQSLRLSTAPRGARSVLLLSHDIDSEEGFRDMARYTEMELRHKVRSTLFVQTKYMSNSVGPLLWSEANRARLRQLAGQGFDVESHSVMHALKFNLFPLGTGQETVADYDPAVDRDGATYHGGSAFGEVRVSKSLLDAELPGHQTVFFRAGHLRVPPGLPEAELRTGYEFDSSFTAPDVLSNFPYHLPVGLQVDRENSVLEFPVTFEDEEAPGFTAHISADLDVIQANADNDAINVLLVHPNDPEHKMPAEEDLLNRLPAGVEVWDLLSFARYYQARERLRWCVEPRGSDEVELLVEAPLAVNGATFESGREISAASSPLGVQVSGRTLILPSLAAGQKMTIRIYYRR
jgi:hypothetical protein